MIRYQFQNLNLRRPSAQSYARCKACDAGVDINGCQCRKCDGSGTVLHYHIEERSAVWQRGLETV